MNKANQPPDKERDKSPPYQNPTNLQKPKPSMFIVGDSMIKKIHGHLLKCSLKHQHFVKTRSFSTA